MTRGPRLDGLAEDPHDASLLDRIRQGDEPAFRELVRRHGRYLFGVARLQVRDDGEAEDVVQETFAAVLKSFRGANFRGESAVKTWLVGIAARQAAKARQKRRLWLRRPDPPDRPLPGAAES